MAVAMDGGNGWWQWSRCDHSARVQRAASLPGPNPAGIPARRSTRPDSSQRDEFHLSRMPCELG